MRDAKLGSEVYQKMQVRLWLIDIESGSPYTIVYTMIRTGIAMKPIKTGNRVVIITGTASANGNTDYRKPIEPRPTARRIVVIRNGKSVADEDNDDSVLIVSQNGHRSCAASVVGLAG